MKTVFAAGLLGAAASAQTAPPVARFADLNPHPSTGDFSKAQAPQPRAPVAAFARLDFEEDDDRHILALLGSDPYDDMLAAAERRRRDDPSLAHAEQLLYSDPYAELLSFANPYTEELKFADPYAEQLQLANPYSRGF